MYFLVSSGQQGASHKYFCLNRWDKLPLGGKSFFLRTILYVMQTVFLQGALDNLINLTYWRHLDSENYDHLNLVILLILIGKQMEINPSSFYTMIFKNQCPVIGFYLSVLTLAEKSIRYNVTTASVCIFSSDASEYDIFNSYCIEPSII